MRLRQERHAVSEMVGVLLLLAIVVALGVLTFSFASGGMSALSESYAGAMSNRANAALEKFAVEQVTFTSSGTLALDGTSTNQVGGVSSSIAATLTTTNANDVIVAFISPGDTGATAPPSVSGISGAGLTWNHRVTTPTETYIENNYVPITLTNNQGSATPTTFQQMVTWNPSTYSAYEASDLGNVRFCADSVCATTFFAWLESCTSSCTPSATSATAWVELTSSIAASGGTQTIYMVFLSTSTSFDGNFWGEAPNIPGTYGMNDNGANVFGGYWNFAGTSLPSGWATTTGSPVNNGLTLSAGAVYTTSTQFAALDNELESYFSITSSTATNYDGMSQSDSQAPQGSNNGGAAEILYITNGFTSINFVAYSNDNAHKGYNQQNTLNLFTPTVNAWYILSSWTSSSLSQVGEQWNYGSAVTASGTSNTNRYIILGYFQGSNSGTTPITPGQVQWVRVRAVAPSNVMPSTSFGSTGNTAITFDVEEWYAAASSTLSSSSITATLSAPDTAATWIAAFGISGANTPSPFDPDISLPATAAGATPSTTISTSKPNDMLLYSCAAGGGGMATGFTSIYSNTFPPNQNEYVGYEIVSATQTNLATSCGVNSYGAEVTDAVVASPAGADVYVRNVGSIPTTLVSVYIMDLTSNSFLSQTSISATVNVGAFVDIPYTTLTFTPTHGHTYSFAVTSSSGKGVIYSARAT